MEICIAWSCLGVVLSATIEILVTVAFGMIVGLFGGAAGFLIATTYVGYRVGGNYKNGAIHGALVGIFMGVVVGVIGIILGITLAGTAGAVTGSLALILGVIVYVIIGMIGGTIGVLLKDRKESSI